MYSNIRRLIFYYWLAMHEILHSFLNWCYFFFYLFLFFFLDLTHSYFTVILRLLHHFRFVRSMVSGVVSKVMTSCKDVYILIFGTCEYVTLWGKGELQWQVELRLLIS